MELSLLIKHSLKEERLLCSDSNSGLIKVLVKMG